MANYAHILIAVLALTSMVLLIKYRNLAMQLNEETNSHFMSKKALEAELTDESKNKKVLEATLASRDQDINKLNNRIKETQVELANSVRAVQASNDQIEVLKGEKSSIAEASDKLAQEKDGLQNQIKLLREELESTKDERIKTKALSDDTAQTLKDIQSKQEKLINDNQQLSLTIDDAKVENQKLSKTVEELKTQLKAAQEDATVAKKKLSDMQNEYQKTKDESKAKEVKGEVKVLEPKAPEPKAQEPKAHELKAEEGDAVPNTDTKEELKDNMIVPASPGKPVKDANQPADKIDNSKGPNETNNNALDVYDMLEESEKEKIKQDIQADAGENGKITGEIIDEEEKGIPVDETGMEVEELDEVEDAQGEVVDDPAKEGQEAVNEVGDGPIGDPSAKKTFEEQYGVNGSFESSDNMIMNLNDGSISGA